MQITYKFILICTILLNSTSCLIDSAKVPSKQIVTIYSDCLSKKDLRLFKNFRKKEKIKIRIISLPTDSIINILKRESYNTTADVIILKSLMGAYKAQKAEVLQSWNSWKMKELVNKKFKSKDNTWFGLGIEPYIFVAKNDTVSDISTFGELLHSKNMDKWSTNLENTSELVPLLAPILQKKKRNLSIEWYSDFMRNQHSQINEVDKKNIPIMTTDVLLTNYTSYIQMSERNDSSDLQLQLIFPNQNTKGAFYNLHCIGIVKQARNFENAKLVVEYFASAETNEKLNNKWTTFPISLHTRIHPFAYQNTFFKISSSSASKLMVNYPNLTKIVKKRRIKTSRIITE
jgi:iron(III) transport system substrate-binding protein